MKKILSSFLLLWLCCAQAVKGQALSLDQLIYLHGQEALTIDTYLKSRGWRLGETVSSDTDSARSAFWYFLNQHNQKAAELMLVYKLGGEPQLDYAFSNKLVFEAAQRKVNDYHMELYSRSLKGGIWNSYMGTNYQVWLYVSSENVGWYGINLTRHGKVQVYLDMGNGTKTKASWVTMEQYRELQAKLEAKRHELPAIDSAAVK